MISIKLVDCKKSKNVRGSNPNITLRLPPNDSPGSWKQQLASLVKRGGIGYDRDGDI